jgi:glycosyltransferase 2 family protein
VHVFFHGAGVFFHHLAAVDFGALGIALGFQALRLIVRTRAWRNIIAAAYPDTRVRWRSVLGAYLGGVGLNAVMPARSGDVLKLFLVHRRVEGSTYPTLAATLVVETLFDACVGILLLLWAAYLGVLPSIHSLPNLPNIDLRWAFQNPVVLEAGALVIGIGIGILLVVATRKVQAFWQRVRQGFAILADFGAYVRRVVSWQALSWVFRLATIYFMLRAFHIPATVHNALIVQIAQSLSTLLPIAPGGAGTEQGLLLYLLRGKASRSALLSFSVGFHIAIVLLNVVLGMAAVLLITRTLRLRQLREEAKADEAASTPAD